MTRIRYHARPGNSTAHKYRGVPTGKMSPATVMVPEAPGTVECHVCHGFVKTVGALYSIPESGIFQRRTKVLAAHQFGGLPARGVMKCIGSHELPQ